MKEQRKILILSLGTGRPRDRKIEKMPGYEGTRYCIDGKYFESEFVAEPLISTFGPDEIIIVGTSRSAWEDLYRKFGEPVDEQSAQRLSEIAAQGGKDKECDELRELSREVEKIYEKGLTPKLFENVKVHVSMIRYGINGDELRENYNLLMCSIREILKEDVHYKVAFDITHSFRSLPLYNLVILDYFRNVSPFDLEISHVYYGNLDIRRENNDIAPVVDMRELTEVLDLSNGVSEFKNTGNAASLLKNIPDEEKDFRDTLERFDWATQINALDKIADSLKRLMEIVDRKDTENSDKYTDLREMISHVIQLKFFEENGMGKMSPQAFEDLPTEEKQFLICKWYFRQNRYGQAVATGMEALKSYLVRIYPEKEKDRQEDTRKASIKRFKDIYHQYLRKKKDRNEIEELMYELEGSMWKATPIRNVFAHNLGKDTTDSMGIRNVDDNIHAKKIVEKFIDDLSRFKECMDTRQKEIEKVYQRTLEEHAGDMRRGGYRGK